MKIVTDLKKFVAKRKITLEVTKHYLNSEFLNTANPLRLETPNANLLYMDYSDNSGVPVLATRRIECETLSLPISQTILENTLSNKLYDKYLTLAKNNEKGYKVFGKRTIENKFLQKIRNYVYGDNNIIIKIFKNIYDGWYIDSTNSDASYRRLVTKIIHCSNNIAVNSRFGPATFIIISKDLGNWMNEFLTTDMENPNVLPFHRFGETSHQIYKIGKLADIDVFVNKNEKKTSILIGRKNYSHEMGGVILAEHEIKIEDRIYWTGFIENTSQGSKYMFDILNVAIEEDLPWYKKLLNKYLKYKNING